MVHYKIEKLQKIPQHEQRSPEWFAQRKDKLTSSDASTVLGINPYSKESELLFKKCGIEKPFIGNVATLHGQKYEDEAINLYCSVTNRTNYDFGLLCYSDVYNENANINHNFLAGSPDGIAINNNNEEEDPVLLEVKCPYKRKIKKGYIPNYYVPQVQLNLYICDLNIADFIEYNPTTLELNIVRIVRDDIWLKNNIPILKQFWEKVEHYRTIGIENHPLYNKIIEKENKKKEQKRKKLELELENNESDSDNILNEIRKKGCII